MLLQAVKSSTTQVTQKFCYGDEDTKIEYQMGLAQVQDVIMPFVHSTMIAYCDIISYGIKNINTNSTL